MENSSPETAVLLIRPFLISAVGSEKRPANRILRRKNKNQTDINDNNHREFSLTKVEGSRYLQVGTLPKVINGRDTELVASFFSEVADCKLCCDNGFFSIAPLPHLGTNLPSLYNVAFDGDRAVTVRRRPLNGDGGLCFVLHHSVNWGIGRMLPGS